MPPLYSKTGLRSPESPATVNPVKTHAWRELSSCCNAVTACAGDTAAVGEPVRVAVPVVEVPVRVAVAAVRVAVAAAGTAADAVAALVVRVATAAVLLVPIVGLAAGAVLGRAVATVVGAVDATGAVVAVGLAPQADSTPSPTTSPPIVR